MDCSRTRGSSVFLSALMQAQENVLAEPEPTVFVTGIDGEKAGIVAFCWVENANWFGTRDALYENDRQSITLTIKTITPEAVGQLIALFERAVGFYATLVNINAYHQPGVEAGKKAAANVLKIEQQIVNHIKVQAQSPETAESIATKLGLESHKEIIFKLLFRLASNQGQIGMKLRTPICDTEFFST